MIRSFLLGIALLGGAVASLLVVDGINARPEKPDLGFEKIDTTRKSHVLILLVDSWRHETAENATIMPAVARLSHEGASGKIETVFEGFSIPAIRAAFSGTAETQLVNLIRNFHFRAIPTESAFLDAMRIGKRTLLVGDEPFAQFGPVFEKRLPSNKGLDMYGLDRLRPAIALDAYRSGAYDIVLCHHETADWRAHEVGIASPRYAEAFAEVDSLIAEFAAARRPGDYLLVFGDHGHNEVGEHKTGLYIPTHGLFIGPDIKANVVFPAIPISDMRFIVDHALGIELKVSQQEAQRLSQFLPVDAGAAAPRGDETNAWRASRSVADYALFALFLLVLAVAAACVVSGESREPLVTAANGAIVLVFAAELLAQQLLQSAWSAFPFLMIVVGVLAWRENRRVGALVALVGVYFVTRFAIESGATSLLRVPIGFAGLVPLDIAGTVAKLALLTGIAGRRNWIAAATATAGLAMLEYRVWDHPALFIGAIVLLALTYWKTRNGSLRQLALVALGYSVLYFTLRLPLYEYAWVDFFLVAIWMANRVAPGAWLDALVITGAFALTCAWLPGGLEWSFLYGLAPAYLVELHVGLFVPFILLKLPILLLLVWCVLGALPSRRFVAMIMCYVAMRFIAVWIVRLMGGGGAEIWPMAEQGIYLTTFLVAALWAYRARANA